MSTIDEFVLPAVATIQDCRSKLLRTIPQRGLGTEDVYQHLQHDIVPGLNRSSQSASFYGFVTGGTTPAAAFADNLVTQHDQNVQVHLPNDTIATDVEDAALRMLCNLVDLEEHEFNNRTFTTGATASNVIGLACGREYIIAEMARRQGKTASVSEDGIIEALRIAGIDSIQILTTVPHSSLRKAASIVGLGRTCVKDLGLFQAKHNFDLAALEQALKTPRTASIVSISCAEVNTGFFATSGDDMKTIRQLCDTYGAWIHVDAAFGLPARYLPKYEPKYAALVDGVKNIILADSIAGDCHKLLNVPYDCGVFFSRHLDIGTRVFQNPNAAYLSSSSESSIPSPLNIGIENSRRFRALPVYATLASYGREGHVELLERQISLARCIAEFIANTPSFQLLPQSPPSFAKVKEQGIARIYNIVLFRATDPEINKELVQRVNATRKIFISGTQWDGQPAARFAISNWQVDVDRDMALIKEVLLSVVS
ncbi:related to L-2,4-diaminobutyrate decarboxylase [Ramularia collo-cygni]|uniref:Related to L-2,4-diaminobutyrate decarboxylase n=1 Tax=Ramularia collo-cygni TaxID=112498 RepID=A0A2D3UW90_9PEZI|nr:related to L-2,4-diaminobutyrate decarboxylase [Ramularia collo-cygni]CZT15326.1 related to L-2,4-diaminobutyrate decarboxylase [Ramularia collo-cygni]